MVQNLVLNNSDHDFSVSMDNLSAPSAITPKVVATPGTDAASRRRRIARSWKSGTLTAAGNGINVEYSA